MPNEHINWRHQAALGFIDEKTKVLDVGCGDGTFLYLLKTRKKCDAVGLDISPHAIKKAAEKGVKAILLNVEQEKFPFNDNEFDYIACLEVLEHLHDPISVLEEMRRVCKTYSIFSYGNTAWWRNRFELLLGKVPTSNPFKSKGGPCHTKGHIYYWNFYDFRDLLASCGFIPIEYEILGGVPLIGRFIPNNLNNRLVRLRHNLLGFGAIWKTQVEKV